MMVMAMSCEYELPGPCRAMCEGVLDFAFRERNSGQER